MDAIPVSQLPLKNRVTALIADAQSTFGVTISINQANRQPEQAQSFHVCHMFLYNFFPNRRPVHCEGKLRTIAWDHLSDAEVVWAGIDHIKSQLLVTREGSAVMLAGRERLGDPLKWQTAPDRHASTQKMKGFLEKHGVRSMAAPGVQGCGEPCGCGGNASKHITGQAFDLGRAGTTGHQDPGGGKRAAHIVGSRRRFVSCQVQPLAAARRAQATGKGALARRGHPEAYPQSSAPGARTGEAKPSARMLTSG